MILAQKLPLNLVLVEMSINYMDLLVLLVVATANDCLYTIRSSLNYILASTTTDVDWLCIAMLTKWQIVNEADCLANKLLSLLSSAYLCRYVI